MAQQPHSAPAPLNVPPPPTLLALREWAATCAAIEGGQQVLLIRKGGIAEPEFTVDEAGVSKRFALLPTLFHQARGSPPPVTRIEVRVVCDLISTREVPSDFDLAALAPFHAYDPAQLATRLAYKPERPLTLIIIRPWRLVTPLTLDLNAIRPVCRSWQEIPVAGPLDCRPIHTTPSPDALLAQWELTHAS